MTHRLLEWILYHALGVTFWLWIIRWGGAERIEGWRAWFLVGWFAGTWDPEQMKAYAQIMLFFEIIWFLIGLFVPPLRFST